LRFSCMYVPISVRVITETLKIEIEKTNKRERERERERLRDKDKYKINKQVNYLSILSIFIEDNNTVTFVFPLFHPPLLLLLFLFYF